MQHTSMEHPPHLSPTARAGNETARFFAVIFRHKWFIIITVVLATAASVFAVLQLPNWFGATVNLVPPKSSAAGGLASGISSALKDFGLSKLTGGDDGYSYIVVLQSKRLQDSLIARFNLAEEYDIPKNEMSLVRAALEENLDITYEKEGNYTITAWHTDPVKAAEMANAAAEIASSIANEIVRTEAVDNRKYAEQRLLENKKSFEQAADSLKNFTRRYKIFAPPEQAAAAATAIADMKAQVLQQEIIVQSYESYLGKDDPATVQQKQLLANLRSQATKVESQPGFVGDFPIEKGSEVAVEYTRLVTDVEVYAKLKAFILPMLEQYKLDEQRALPNLYVLDAATPPDKKGRPKRSLIVAGAAFGSFVITIMFVFFWDRYRVLKQTYPYVFNGKMPIPQTQEQDHNA